MSHVRKVVIILVALCYLMVLPPMFNLYNKPILVMGVPMFLFVLVALVLLMNMLIFFLYQYEEKQEHKRNE